MSVDMIARGMAAAAAKSGGGSQLPPSTAADKDKFLRADDSGNPAWEAVNVAEKLVVTGAMGVDNNGNPTIINVDKTGAEIEAAYAAGMDIEFHIDSEGEVYNLGSSDYVGIFDSKYPTFTWTNFLEASLIFLLQLIIENGVDKWFISFLQLATYEELQDIRQLPASTAADKDKFLRVDASGNPAWETVSDTTIKLKSSTAGSTKYFNITVNDSGQITATEAT